MKKIKKFLLITMAFFAVGVAGCNRADNKPQKIMSTDFVSQEQFEKIQIGMTPGECLLTIPVKPVSIAFEDEPTKKDYKQVTSICWQGLREYDTATVFFEGGVCVNKEYRNAKDEYDTEQKAKKKGLF